MTPWPILPFISLAIQVIILCSFRNANLNFLLSTLSSNGTRRNGFYNSTVGGRNASDAAVYGLFMCRGDVSGSVCRTCVGDATVAILQRCPNQMTATIWYDYCMLRYSDGPLYGRPDQSSDIFILRNGHKDSQPERFMQSVGNTLDQVVTLVVNDESPDKKFATQEANVTASESIYCLGQCRPDLSDLDCRTCLSIAIQGLKSCCYSELGARYLTPDCNIWYETYLFYSTANSAPPPQAPIRPPPPITYNISAPNEENRGSSSSKVIIAIVVPITGIILLTAIFCFVRIRNAKKRHTRLQKTDMNGVSAEESSQYDLAMVKAITNDFSLKCKIGQGGYGSVYKGMLPNGQEVAIKRLSKSSKQGAQEFKNEVEVVVKLQHRNLVSGYMSPEYAMHGEFSVKSDVFSLGVILLEIITGKKNRNISKENRTVDLLGYAWEYWRDDTPLEILDPVLAKSYNVNEVIQCIHISLLCVQEVAVERPTMAEVMMMLSSYSSNKWSAPREPAFYHGGREGIPKESESEKPVSINEVSISQFHPR
nr:cysteine-rich receptor-like protein kinase 25 [Ipomoea batatas]GME17909.1 cysteine-rich receptor-like protein kinase 25 [Ipomoea batatas]